VRKVGVCIVNYKTPHLVEECLAGLESLGNQDTSLNVVVVNNESGDDSVDRLNAFIEDKKWHSWVTIIDGEINGGFSYGNNIAIRHLKDHFQPEYFWLLNPDTLPLPDSLQQLIETLNSDDTIGIAGSRLQDEDGTGQIAAFNFPKPFGDFVNTLGVGFIRRLFSRYVIAERLHEGEPEQVDWVAGASMLIRASVIDKVGLMDDHYFLYFEEVDYCLAAKNTGFSTYIVPSSLVIHHVGAATGISDTRKQAPRRPRYWFESRKRFFAKNYGTFGLLLADCLWMFAYILHSLKNKLKGKESFNPPHFLKDFFANSIFITGTTYQATHLLKKPVSSETETTEPTETMDFFDGSNARLGSIIKEDWQAHGKDWTKPGFRAVAVHRFGVWRMQVKPKLLRAPLSIFYRFLYRRVRNHYSIELPYSAKLGRRVVIEHQGAIVIHGQSQIGADSILRQGVTLGNRRLTHPEEAPVIGCRVNIGAGAKLMGAINIGDDANIGANAVVLKDVPTEATAIGIPAKILDR